MIKSYLKTTLRYIFKHKLHTFINIVGLGVGLAVCLLMGLYIVFETSYDKQLTSVWRLYVENFENGVLSVKDGNTHSAAGSTLKAEIPEIEDFTRVFNHGEQDFAMVVEEKPLMQKQVFMVDESFLEIFDCKVVGGKSKGLLSKPYTAVLTRSAAEKLFGNQTVLGKNIRFSGGFFEGNYTITGLIEDSPTTTHLKYEILLSFQTRYSKGLKDNWEDYWEYTYLKLKENTDSKLVRSKIKQVCAKHLKNENISLNMQYVPDIHLHSDLTYEIEANSKAQIVYFWGLIAIFILAIACLNYINLATAKSLLRSKEVAMRKIIGAKREQVIQQFLMEAILLNAFAWLVAVWLADLLLPFFAQMMARPLSWVILAPYLWAFPIFYLFSVLSSGFYPSFVLSSFVPLSIFQSKVYGSRVSLRKALIILQFIISIILISGTIIVLEQVQFLRKHEKGLNIDQMLVVKAPQFDWRQDSLYREKYDVFKNNALAINNVKNITTSSVVSGAGLATISGTSAGVQWAKGNINVTTAVYFVEIEEKFFEVYEIPILSGKVANLFDLRAENREVMLNRAALKVLGFPSVESAVGEFLFFANNPQNRVKIVGVVENFAIQSLKVPPTPTIYNVKPAGSLAYYSLKINEKANPSQLLSQIETSWKGIYPEQPLQYFWLKEKYDEQYADEKQLGYVFSLFAGLAILLSCLGLLGLVTFMAETRTKEIGVRKVLGASVLQIATLLSKDFLKLVLVAFLIASPVAYYFMDKWLADFTYRVEISWWVFAFAGIFAVLIATFTVSWQSIKAALMNPVKSLRSE
ncbi:MAG: ABC transporter permease [Cytophagales bacterium]|nr:MAG: ABC transporter permease [Cytophagales bacterium]